MVFKVMFLSLLVNIFLTFLKIIGGILGNSKTLVADGIHSFSDLATDVVAIIGNKFSTLPPDSDHPYGHGKYEYVTSILISFMIISLSIIIFINAFNSNVIIPSKWVLLILFFTLIIKSILAKYILKQGKLHNNSILITSGIESKYDALSSFLALIFVFFSEFGSYCSILKYLDIVGGIIISLLVLKIGLSCLSQNLKSVIGQVDYNNKYIDEVKQKVLNVKFIIDVENVKLFKYGSYYSVEIIVLVNKNKKLKDIYKIENNIKNILREKDIFKFVSIDFIPK